MLELPKPDRRIVGAGLKDPELGWPIGMPLCSALGGGPFELRVSLRSRRIARVVACLHGGELFALHGFIKKTQTAPERSEAGAEPQAPAGEGEMSKKNANPHRGSSLDDSLEEEGILEDTTAKTAKKALSGQLAQAMKEQNVTKATLARRMKTSRAQLDRLLDPENRSATL